AGGRNRARRSHGRCHIRRLPRRLIPLPPRRAAAYPATMTNIFAPFEPEGDEPKRRRFKPIPVRMLLPNMITLLALCLGLTGIRMALEDRLELAIGCIVVAAVLD